jgi:hypothetical protein
MFGGVWVVRIGRIAVHRSLLHAVGSCNRQQIPDPTKGVEIVVVLHHFE